MKKFLRARLSTENSSGLLLTLLLLALISAVFVFGAIAEDVVNRDPLTVLDVRFSAWLHGHQVAYLTWFMLMVTHMHSTIGVTIMTLAVSAYLWRKRYRTEVLLLMAAVFGGMLLNATLKQIFMRARPQMENPILTLTSYSFPSGHSMMATVFYGALCFLLVTRVRGPLARGLTIVVSGCLILLVGFSRIYLGVHYLSDVVAAIAEGLAWLACVIVVEELRRRRKRRAEGSEDSPGAAKEL